MNINPKDHISCSARDMRAWRDEKPVLEKELSQPDGTPTITSSING